MKESLILLVPLLVLPVVLVFAFSGCVGDQPTFEQGKQQAKQEAAEAAKYQNVIGAEADLIGYWRLNEPETGDQTAYDSAPSPTHNGEYKNPSHVSKGEKGPLSAQDPNDKAAQFDGQGGYVEVPYDGLLNPPFDFSVELWIRPEVGAGGPGNELVLDSYESTVSRGFYLGLQRADGGAPPTIMASVQGDIEASLGDGLEHEGWRHVVFTYSAAAQEMNLYVNADSGNPAVDPVNFPYVANSSMPLRIAGMPEQQQPFLFNGRIAEVALYRRALEGKEVRAHFLDAITPLPS